MVDRRRRCAPQHRAAADASSSATPASACTPARSRNDQVATDLRLWLRGAIDGLHAQLAALRRAFIDLAEQHAATIMPGFTHLQVAQPVTFGHHLLAYDAMFARDMERFVDCRKRVNRLPLGAAALAGTSFPIDRAHVARELGFDEVAGNSLDAVADRDFAIEFEAAASLVMVHLSRFAEELVLWSSPRFAFVTLADRFCTGSSIMPQKKNPDVPELVRGKSGRVIGHLVSLLVLMKGQPLTYNKDNQEDKEPLFDTVDTLADTLAIMTDLVAGGIRVNAERMRAAAAEGFATATDLADYLVRRGAPFRDAHEAVARAVRHAEAKGVDLSGASGGRATSVFAAGGRRRARGVDARGLGREPRPRRRNRPFASACRRGRGTPNAALTEKAEKEDEARIPRPWRHGISHGRPPRARRPRRDRLQPKRGEVRAMGRQARRPQRRHTRRRRRRTRRS